MSDVEQSRRDQALERDILAVYRQVEEAWAKGDAQGVARNFAAYGDLIDPFGHVARHRDEVAHLLEQTLTGPFKLSQIKFMPELTRRLTDDVAVSDGTWQVTLPPQGAGSPPPAIGGRLTTVFRKEEDEWQIESDRPMLPAPPLPGTSPPTTGRPD